MTVLLNGVATELTAGATLADAVRSLGHDPARPGVAAAVDGEVIRRAVWDATTLADGAAIEVLTAVQGGSR